jgi:hypothetical protein
MQLYIHRLQLRRPLKAHHLPEAHLQPRVARLKASGHSTFRFTVYDGSLLTLYSKSTAAAIGGAVGGIATLAAVVFAVIYCRKRNRKQANDISDSPMLLTSPMASDAPVTAQTPTTPSTFRPPAEVEAARASANLVGVIPTSTDDTELTARLTQEQSELVQGLIKYNVPLPAVVGALEGILRGDRNSGGGEGSGSQLTQSDLRVEAEKPPVYDFT